jgi:hypothetical protein
MFLGIGEFFVPAIMNIENTNVDQVYDPQRMEEPS